MNPLWVEVGSRTLGVALGTAAGLVIAEANTLPGVMKRVGISIGSGYVFADAAADWFGWSMIYPNRMIAASWVASMVGWFAMHAVIRAAQAWKKS